MLKLYYTPISINSRRVWISLLEKQLPFELVLMKLDGDQLQPEFLALNPFHHIPVLEDNGFTAIESYAILDYLEAKYPTPSFLPTDPQAFATVRMVEMVALNELMPAMNPLIRQMMGFGEEDPQTLSDSKEKVRKVLSFFESKLGDRTFFTSEQLTLGDIVAGTAVPFLPHMGVSLEDYPKLKDWCDRLMQRDSWQQTQPTPEQIEAAKAQVKKFMTQKG